MPEMTGRRVEITSSWVELTTGGDKFFNESRWEVEFLTHLSRSKTRLPWARPSVVGPSYS